MLTPVSEMKKGMKAKGKQHQSAIVTGASSGIGLGITQALLERGYHVVANSRTISKSKDLKASENLVLVDGDIGKKNTAIKVADAAIRHFDRIDLLVNTAGIYIPKPFTEYTPEDFEMMIGTNVAGYFFITQQVVTQMRKQKSGHIVSISTVLTDQPLAGAPISLPVLTKSTIPAFSRALAMEFVADGIRVNTISPGVVDTPMHANDDHEALKKLHPIPRLVQISEIVDALFYLQSAPMVNGENIRIDGGAHAGAKW
ncbi:MAG TPA: SDR family oxidoreductase [Blastocatellia bacterium]|jgi:NAD(P)-dependent dehydrogenase (short-subunit alcohol dehydrogenase family)|nr:SDR family oxidoreductase [Blastocatellia bacterium]